MHAMGAPLTHAVFGHPVAHSLSPRIHAAFAAQCGIDMRYGAVDAAPEVFADAVASFAHDGGRGANVTLPHKPAALALCATATDRAYRAGAVNTLVRVDDHWHGDVTDGSGLLRDLARHQVQLDGARVLVLGAGGATRGIAGPLLDAGVASLLVANRTLATAQALCATLDDPRARACTLDAPTARGDVDAIDLLINATSAARGDAGFAWPVVPLHASSTCVDLGYGHAARTFLDWARAHGMRTRIDGLGMLVEQAAESFALWHGTWPDAQAVLAALRLEHAEPA